MTEVDLATVRANLAEDFERKAEWRAQQVEQHSKDPRYRRAAEGLRKLADYVRELPDEDARLQVISAAWSTGLADVSAVDTLLNSYSFGPGSHLVLPNPDDFFTRVALEWSRQAAVASEYRQAPERIHNLIASDPSGRDVVAVAHRRRSIEKFRRLLSDPDYFDEQRRQQGRGPEVVWQTFLEDNRWILGGSLSLQFMHGWSNEHLEQVVVGSSVAGAGKRNDALLRTAGRANALVFVEIKHHRTALLGDQYRSGCWAPSKDLSGGVAQVQGTVQRAVTAIGNRLQKRASDGSDIPGDFSYLLRPRSYLIIGSMDELFGEHGGINFDKYQSFELYRRHTEEPEIVTFDELLARTEGLLDVSDV